MFSQESKLIGYLVQMMPTLRRAHGLSLDVPRFMHDRDYAQLILVKALQSEDKRLLECGRYAEKLRFGPRSHMSSGYPLAVRITESVPMKSGDETQRVDGSENLPETTEEELKARILKRYMSSLR